MGSLDRTLLLHVKPGIFFKARQHADFAPHCYTEVSIIEDYLRQSAIAIFRAAVAAADAGNAVRNHLTLRDGRLRAGNLEFPLNKFDRIFVIGAGKAAIPMAAAVEQILGPCLARGIVITKYGHLTSGLRYLSSVEAGHPIPDAAGAGAARAIRELLSQLNARDLCLVLISGGASALLVGPAEPVTLAAKQETTNLLLRAGATIFQLNAVRKHLSTLKGGQLAALAHPATVVALLLSDVIGDPLDVIGSGPTAPDPSTFADAIAVLEEFDLLDKVPLPVRQYLEQGVSGSNPETPKPGDPVFDTVHNVIVGSNRIALEAAEREAKLRQLHTLILSTTFQGEACEVARFHASILREIVTSAHPIPSPACILSGGECTVTVRGGGTGGRSQEFALASALSIAGLPGVLVLSGGTDGTDGPTDAAGAIATGQTIERAARLGLNAEDYLARNDSYPFFDALGDLIKIGPTGTNVMDVNILLAG